MKRFDIGDIVYIEPGSPLYPALASDDSFGIIKGSGRLLYVHDWETEEVLKEFWAYDVIVEGQVFENVPEDGLRALEDNEDGEDEF
jgi:hypothetical protein|tara:strand:+ start:49 stop:306 length:258 start_codon:yes stop_codon:yes gene_type:complete